MLRVCVQIINDALYAVGQYGRRTLSVTAESKDGLAIINISDVSIAGSSSGNPETKEEKEEDQTISGLGLSACQGILRQHHGQILWQQNPNSGITIRVEIPIILPALEKEREKSTAAGVPVMWEPQPFA